MNPSLPACLQRRRSRFRAVAAFLWAVGGASSLLAQPADYPPGIREVHYPSSGDDSRQPALAWWPESQPPVPLLVALHTWSGDYRQAGGEVQYARWCQRAGWAFIHPDFRGPNRTPAAMGSDRSVADISSAVAWVKSQTRIDDRRVYGVGVSGGGHAALLVAARKPQLWAGVSAWCGIADLAAWHRQCRGSRFARYATMIESALGGSPQHAPDLRQAAAHRSPITWLRSTRPLPPLDINHGLDDGRSGSVPFTHSIRAWNATVPPADRISERAIASFYAQRHVPEALAGQNEATADPLYGDRQPMFRRTAGASRLTIFRGGHEIVHHAALNWLAAQQRGRPANWQPDRLIRLDARATGRPSGK